MVLIIVALVLIALAVLSPRWGYDSRDTVRSKEQEFASYGMSWQDTLGYEQELADELVVALRKRNDRLTERAA